MTIDAQNSLQLILSSLILGTFPTLRCGCIRLAASITMSLPAGLIPTGPTRRWKKEFAGYTNQKRVWSTRGDSLDLQVCWVSVAACHPLIRILNWFLDVISGSTREGRGPGCPTPQLILRSTFFFFFSSGDFIRKEEFVRCCHSKFFLQGVA